MEKELMQEEEILANKVKAVRGSFIYFLIKNDKIVYVGSTTVGLGRIYNHSSTKDFDYYSYIRCDEEKIFELEDDYIIKYKPLYNQKINTQKYVSTGHITRHNIMNLRLFKYIIKRYKIKNVFDEFRNSELYSKEQILKALDDCIKKGIAYKKTGSKYDIIPIAKRRELGYE